MTDATNSFGQFPCNAEIELRVAAQALLDACTEDFGNEEGEDDDGWVMSGEGGDSAVKFGHLRRLRAALATPADSGAQTGDR